MLLERGTQRRIKTTITFTRRGQVKIEIITVPLGPAAFKVEEQWVGVQMEADAMPAENILGAPSAERDLASGAWQDSRGGWVVDREVALAALERRSPQAAAWFREHLGPEVTNLSFGANEARVAA